jgi:hypothetical protein
MVLTLALPVAVSAAGTPAERSGATPPAGESLSAWQWYQTVDPPKGKPKLADFLLTPAIFDRAQSELHDLRLYDEQGREVPYALRVRRQQDEQRPLSARQFNQATNDDRSAEVSLDLGEEKVEHNEIEVATTGKEFRRALRIEGSDDAQKWSTLLKDVHLLHFEDARGPVDVRKFRYTPSHYRYLRVRVSPYAGVTDDAPAITAVTVYHSLRIPGEYVTQEANLQEREPVPADGGPGSAWLITFGNNELTACESLTFEVSDTEFVRPYRLEIANPNEPHRTVAQDEWKRRSRDERKPMVISLRQEVTVRRLRLVVTDYRNPPLNLTGVKYTAPARQVIFAPPADALGPLRLYFGNPNAQEPGYDFASALPTLIEPPPARTTLGELRGEPEKNPEYEPPPKPWSERWPWVVYLVLGTSSLVLLGILSMLGRESIARHDAALS